MASLQQFREWAVKNGKVANPDGSYKGQCVSLIQQYLKQVFGIPYKPRGNAKDFVPPGFVRVSNLRPGDIVRYGSNYGGGYGHIGIIDDDGRYLDQNGIRVLAVGRRGKPFSGINAIFRPTKKFNVKTPKPKAKPKPKQIIHIVKSGEYASSIAKKYKTTLANLKKLNPKKKNWNLIYPGDKIRVK